MPRNRDVTETDGGSGAGAAFARLADRELAHRGLVAAVLAVASLAALALLTRLEFDFRPEALLEFSREEEEFARVFRQRFAVGDDVLLVVLAGSRPGAVLDERGLELLYRLTEAAAASPISESALSLATVPRRDAAGAMTALVLGRPPPLVASLPVAAETAAAARRQVEGSRLLRGQLVADDGSAAAVVVELAADYRDHSRLDRPLAALEADLERLLREEAATAPESGTTYALHLGGLPFVRVETVRSLKREQRVFWPLTAALYLGVLAFLYRRAVLAAAPLVAVGLATLWGLALLPLTGRQVNVVNNIVPSLILVIGVANAVHMLHAFRTARRAGLEAPAAARAMMAELGLPAFLTSLTTAIGFGSLVVARNGTLRDLGWQAAAGVLFSYVALVTLFPLVLGRLRGEVPPGPRGERTELAVLGRLVAALGRRPRTVLALALAGLALAVASGARTRIDADLVDNFPSGHPIYESNRLVEEKLGGILPLEVVLAGPRPGYFEEPEALRAVFALERELARLPGVIGVTSPVDLVAEVHGVRDDGEVGALLTAPRVASALAVLESFDGDALAAYLDADRSRLRLAARLRGDGIRASLRTLERIEELEPAWLAPFGGEVSMRLTGQAYIAARGLDFFIRDLLTSLATASLVIFAVLVVVFRSLRLGLLSLLPTALPLAATLGMMPVYGYRLNTTTAIVFTITIGMAVDNVIHLLSRFRAARRQGYPLAEAIELTYRRAGAAVVASNLLLMGGFAVLFASDFEPVYRVAVLTTTTIGAALLASLLVLPALLTLFGAPIGTSRS